MRKLNRKSVRSALYQRRNGYTESGGLYDEYTERELEKMCEIKCKCCGEKFLPESKAEYCVYCMSELYHIRHREHHLHYERIRRQKRANANKYHRFMENISFLTNRHLGAGI